MRPISTASAIVFVLVSSSMLAGCCGQSDTSTGAGEPPAAVSQAPEAANAPAEQAGLSSEIDEPELAAATPTPEELEENRQEERIAKILRLSAGTPVDCVGLSQEDVLPSDVCQELGFAIENGRTRPRGRTIVKAHLKDHGLRKIRAYLVARVGHRQYEVAKLGYNDYFDISYPTNKHFLLETLSTDFSSAGRFTMWVRQTGTRTIELKNGFTDEWHVYQESPLGELWQAVRDAPAGAQTQESARSLLRFVTIAKALEVARGYRPTDKQVMEFIMSQ